MGTEVIIGAVGLLVGVIIVALITLIALFNGRMVDALHQFERIDRVLAAYSNAALLLEHDLSAIKIDSVPVREHLEQLVILRDAYDPDEPEHMLLGRTLKFIEKKLAENTQLREKLQAVHIQMETMHMLADERSDRQREICADADASEFFVSALGVGGSR